MGIEYILVALFMANGNQIGTTYVSRFTTSTACEGAAPVLRQGNSQNGPERKYECVKYDPSK